MLKWLIKGLLYTIINCEEDENNNDSNIDQQLFEVDHETDRCHEVEPIVKDNTIDNNDNIDRRIHKCGNTSWFDQVRAEQRHANLQSLRLVEVCNEKRLKAFHRQIFNTYSSCE